MQIIRNTDQQVWQNCKKITKHTTDNKTYICPLTISRKSTVQYALYMLSHIVLFELNKHYNVLLCLEFLVTLD